MAEKRKRKNETVSIIAEIVRTRISSGRESQNHCLHWYIVSESVPEIVKTERVTTSICNGRLSQNHPPQEQKRSIISTHND